MASASPVRGRNAPYHRVVQGESFEDKIIMAKSIELARQPETIYIKPSTGLTALNLRDLWIYRELSTS